MGNKNQIMQNPRADTCGQSAVALSQGIIVTPIAENSEAVVFSTQFRSPYPATMQGPREIQSMLGQSHGRYLVRPKNPLANGKVLQVKSMNPQPTKLFYVVRKQDGVDQWIDVE